MARGQKVREFILAKSSYWPEVALAKSGQNATDRVNSQVPEDEVARCRIGHRSKWPGVELARTTRHSDVKASKTKVKRGTTGRYLR